VPVRETAVFACDARPKRPLRGGCVVTERNDLHANELVPAEDLIEEGGTPYSKVTSHRLERVELSLRSCVEISDSGPKGINVGELPFQCGFAARQFVGTLIKDPTLTAGALILNQDLAMSSHLEDCDLAPGIAAPILLGRLGAPRR
jgi:hypothetical protein